WGVAVAAPSAALGLNWVIGRISGADLSRFDTTMFGGMFPDAFLIAAVMIVAQVSGRRPTVLALLVSAAYLDYFFVPPAWSFSIPPDFIPSLVQFLAPAVFGWWFIEKRRSVELLLERETALAKRLQGDQTLDSLGKSVLGYLAPELGAPIATFYSVE